MFNEVIVIGKLVNEPTIKETHDGKKMSVIVLDVLRPYRNNLGIRDHDYISCVLWQGVANQVKDCCEIGSFLGIRGRLQSRSFESDEKHSTTFMEVKVEHVEFLDKYFFHEKLR